MPKISGRFIKRGELPEIREPYKGACTNSTMFCILIGNKVSLMIDRFMANGYTLQGTNGCPSWVDGNLQALVFPMFGHWGREYWNPGQIEPMATWRKNVYPEGGGTLEYRLYFLNETKKEEVAKLATSIYYLSRKESLEKYYYPRWREVSSTPKDKIAFCAFVAGNWGGGIENMSNSYFSCLKQMREILDQNGLKDYYIYFWVMLYDKKRAGWGYFPTNVEEIKKFYSMLREKIHNIKLGLYVNYWCGSAKVPAYREHPEWYTAQKYTCDGGDPGYMGKLPGWGKYVIEGTTKIIKAYNLDFVFLDNAGFSPAYQGTIEQNQAYAKRLDEAVHKMGAYTVGNGNCPYWDINYLETRAGDNECRDRENVEQYHNKFFGDFIFGPEIHPLNPGIKIPPEEKLRKSGEAFLKWYADKPQFIPRFPVHFGGNLRNILIKEIFTPYVKKLSGRKKIKLKY